uniref:Uncharacterized protein n=1 Tax=Peronospora matthiolae TaxID=2874970 RepID=A0AAV1UG45_9STRA
MEASQGRLEEKERLKGHEASVFGSVLGQGKAMTREALDVSPSRRVSPGVSPSTYFGARQPGYAGAAAKVEMAQAPQPVLPQHYVPPPMYQPAPPPHMAPGLQSDLVPDTRPMKLGIRPFDGKELYQGLGSGNFIVGQEICKADHVEGRFEEQPTLEQAMQRLLHTFATKITPAQSMKIFTAPKSIKRSWTEHYLYLVEVSTT